MDKFYFVLLYGKIKLSRNFQSLVKSAFGNSVVHLVPNPEELVAKGCAVQCHIVHSSARLSISEIPKRIPLSPLELVAKSSDGSRVLVALRSPLPAAFTLDVPCDIVMTYADSSPLITLSGLHTTGILNEKGLFIKNAEQSVELSF